MMSGSADPINELIESCFKVKDNAYCPYSKFPVGAAVLCRDGTIFAGCNVENAAYPLGVCAENTAISKAVSEGHTKFKAIAVCSDLAHSFITPCGSCRQILAEFGMDWDVYMTRPDRSFLKMKVRELLPLGFSPESMEEEKVSVTTDHMPQISKIGQVNGTGTVGQVNGTSKVGQVNLTTNGTGTEHRNGDPPHNEMVQ